MGQREDDPVAWFFSGKSCRCYPCTEPATQWCAEPYTDFGACDDHIDDLRSFMVQVAEAQEADKDLTDHERLVKSLLYTLRLHLKLAQEKGERRRVHMFNLLVDAVLFTSEPTHAMMEAFYEVMGPVFDDAEDTLDLGSTRFTLLSLGFHLNPDLTHADC